MLCERRTPKTMSESVQKQPSLTAAAPDAGRYTGALITVTTLFFMWGFLTALNDILVPHLKSIFELNYREGILVQTEGQALQTNYR